MPALSPEGSSTNSKPASKGSAQAAQQAAAAAFQSESTLTLAATDSGIPPEQSGRRRLTGTYLIQRERLLPDPDQPRQQFDEQELTDLTRSIEARGIKQPLTVRWSPEQSRYMIIDGGRRFEAATRLKLDELPCWIQTGEARDVLIDQIVHNWQRSDLRPYETADALARLRDDHGLSQVEIARVTGKSKAEISKFLALHDKVVPDVQDLARSDAGSALSRRHLYSLSRLAPEEQGDLAQRIIREQLTADRTDQLTRPASRSEKPTTRRPKGIQSRQRHFKTSKADVLITFQKQSITDDDIAATVTELASQLGLMTG